MNNKGARAAWEELSPIQKEVVEWNEGPLLVLAGPGSGKTRVLTCRIANILDSSSNMNFRILGLTFTNKAADEMRTRVAEFVPGHEGRLFLGTFHSFCADVLRQHGTHLGINPNFKIYSQDADLQALLNDAVEKAKKTSDLVSDRDKRVLPIIKRLKSLLIQPEQCCDRFPDEELGNRMAAVYPAYEAELAKRNALDFNSLIFRAHQLFRKFPAFARRYRTVYPYICVDEFQDTNHAQYNLIRSLTGEQHKNLFVVADDDQIIYRWNGASHRRLAEFIKDYSPRVIQLPMNYRCPSEVVELANNLIQHNFLRTPDKEPLKAFRSSQANKPAHFLLSFPDLQTEAAGVAQDIHQLHSADLSSVVVLGRSRKLLQSFESALRSEGISAVISQRKDEFVSTPFVWLHSILRLANDRQNEGNLEAICGTFDQLTHLDVDPDEVMTYAQASNRDYLQHWIKVVRPKIMDPAVGEVVDQTLQYLGEGREFGTFSRIALDWFNMLLQSGGTTNGDPAAEVFAGYEEERLVWEQLMREIKQSLGSEIGLEAFLHELEMRSKEPPPSSNTVVLMTIHGAKGKEFDHVYLVGLVDDELPSFQSKRRGDDSPEMEEERRNCFVAITRTIKTLTVSYAGKYRGWAKEPSRFLFEMGLLKDQD